MIIITFQHMVGFITIAWIVSRVIAYFINKKTTLKNELKMLMVYICLIVISRMVYFPLHHVDGHIGTLVFDKDRIYPLWLSLKPFTFAWERYDGWQINVIGNIAMFIPVGIVWPVCFKKLNNFGKTVLAGAAYSFLIEMSQLLFYDRGTDIDDLILNTTGVVIGALIYFLIHNKSSTGDRK